MGGYHRDSISIGSNQPTEKKEVLIVIYKICTAFLSTVRLRPHKKLQNEYCCFIVLHPSQGKNKIHKPFPSPQGNSAKLTVHFYHISHFTSRERHGFMDLLNSSSSSKKMRMKLNLIESPVEKCPRGKTKCTLNLMPSNNMILNVIFVKLCSFNKFR